MYRKVATVAENNGVCVFTVAIIADSTLAVLLFAWPNCFTIDSSS
jgi:hypothetical protein